jgi:23S rRNA (pseudouridine1915-N3)-methyltransferase
VKLRVVWAGKTKDPNLTRLISDYASRIQRFLPFELNETKEPRTNQKLRVREEGEKLLSCLDASDRVVLLDSRGRLFTSEQFAAFLQKHMSEDPRPLAFVIGGFAGISDAVKKRADLQWSLSPLTFTHDVTRVLVLEQIYRALCTIHNHPYSK